MAAILTKKFNSYYAARPGRFTSAEGIQESKEWIC